MAAGIYNIAKASALWFITHVRSSLAAKLQLPLTLSYWSRSSNTPGPWTQQPSQGLWSLKEGRCGGRKQMEPVRLGVRANTHSTLWLPPGTPVEDLQ